jgi:UDP:flavonoid glycosyltransferase YjiC (YdhE family)
LANVVFAWELGGDYGHLSRILPIARALRSRGHSVSIVARELIAAERLIGPHDIAWYQAPLWSGQLLNMPDPVSFAELLMRFGFLNPAGLTGMCRAWRNLLALIGADMVVMDFAPTALLATRGMPLRRVHLGDGFCIPPQARPIPLFRWWEPQAARLAPRLADSEERVRRNATEVLLDLGAPPLLHFGELFDCDATLMAAFPGLDHYGERAGIRYRGPIFDLGQGAPALWADGEGPRVFAYLKPGYPGLERLLGALAGSGCRVLAHVPGIARALVDKFGSGRMRFSEAPIDMRSASAQCDAAICHGGQGTMSAMLLAGRPLLLLPMQMEQTMAAHRVTQVGAALSAMPDGVAGAARLLARLVGESSFREAAGRFGAAHAGHDQVALVTSVADELEALLA